MRILLTTILALSIGVARAEPVTLWTGLQALGTIIQVSELIKSNDKVYQVRVRGQGPTEDEARTQAYKKAVEYAVGAYVASGTEVVNGEVSVKKIIKYSSGYVDRFDTVEVGNGYVIMDVYVRTSKIAAGMLKEGKTSGKIDGDQIAAQNATFLESKKNGDEALNMVLAKFKQSAYVVTTGNYRSYVNERRQATIDIPYKVQWNYDYLISIAQAASMTQEPANVSTPKKFLATFVDSMSGKNCVYHPDSCESTRIQGNPAYLTVVANPNLAAGGSGKFKIGDQSTFEFQRGGTRWNLLSTALFGMNELSLELSIYDSNNRLVHKDCVSNMSTNMVINKGGEVVLFGTQSYQGNITITTPTKPDNYTYKVKVFCEV
jgi:hypothetical protein